MPRSSEITLYVAATMPIGGPHFFSGHTAVRACIARTDVHGRTIRINPVGLSSEIDGGKYARVMHLSYELFSPRRRDRSADLSWSFGTGLRQRHHRLG